MKTEERLRLLLTAPPKAIEVIDAVLSGKPHAAPPSVRLLTMAEASRRLGISRQTCWRMCSETPPRLRRVEVRKGSFRIPETALIDLVRGKR